MSIAEPLGIDQSLWASAVRGMSRGQLLYRDVWEQRPPGIYLIYLAGFRVFGWTASTVAWLDILAATATVLLLVAIVRPLGGRTMAAAAAAVYAVLTMPAWLYRYGGFLERSVCETFIVVCVALAAFCAVKWRAGQSAATAIGVGFFAGAAMVFKPNAGLYLPALLIWMVLYRLDATAPGRALPLRGLGLAIISAGVAPAITIIWLWSIGVLDEARIAVIDFNRFYVGQGFTVGGYALAFSKAVWLRMKTDALWLAGGVGALVAVWELARTRRLPPIAGLAVLWGAAAALAIIVNGIRLFNSYFIQALAPLAVLTAWLLAEAVWRSLVLRLIGVTTAALMLMVLLQRHYPAKVVGSARMDFDALAGRSSPVWYLDQFGGYDNRRGYSARANAELAAYVRDHTAANDRVFLFGISGAGLYFNADRLIAHRFLRVNFFVPTEFPDPRFQLGRVVEDLSISRPAYLIFEKLHGTTEMAKAVDALIEQPEVVQLLQTYRFETQIEDFALYRRVD